MNLEESREFLRMRQELDEVLTFLNTHFAKDEKAKTNEDTKTEEDKSIKQGRDSK